MAHEPVALKVTSPALMVHTDAEADSMLNVTALPEAPPVAVTWYVPPVDVLAVELVNVMAWGASPVTLSVRSWVTDLVDESASLVADAVTVKSYVPSLPASGVPAIVAVPLPLSTNVRPLGRPIVGATGVRLSAANGNPVAVTENDDGWATVNAADDALVITGGLSTVSVKAWVTTPKGLERLRVTCETPSAVDAGGERTRDRDGGEGIGAPDALLVPDGHRIGLAGLEDRRLARQRDDAAALRRELSATAATAARGRRRGTADAAGADPTSATTAAATTTALAGCRRAVTSRADDPAA